MNDRDEPYQITPEIVSRFRAQGHITLGQVLSADTLARYAARITTLVAERSSTEPLAKRSTYGKAFQQVMNLWVVDAVAREFVFSRRLARLVAELMGVEGVRLYHDQALYKEPGGGITPWHCDQMHWPLQTMHTCVAWIPFQDVPLEMGPLCFASGSHRADLGRHLMLSDESERVIAAKLTDLPVVEQPFRLGDISFHYGWTFHRAPANRTERMRQVMTILYMEENARIAKPTWAGQQSDWDMWCPGVAVGEIAASALNPVLYSEARGREYAPAAAVERGIGVDAQRI